MIVPPFCWWAFWAWEDSNLPSSMLVVTVYLRPKFTCVKFWIVLLNKSWRSGSELVLLGWFVLRVRVNLFQTCVTVEFIAEIHWEGVLQVMLDPAAYKTPSLLSFISAFHDISFIFTHALVVPPLPSTADSWCFPYKWLLFSCSVLSDSLWSHGLQHARLPCPSPSPGACSSSCPWSQWWLSIKWLRHL